MSSQTQQLVRALSTSDGAGVNLKRSIGTSSLRNLDPFLMLDHFSSDNPDDYLAGFPSHPHRGFITFTYMIEGDMAHEDSMGNKGNLGPGGAQWMKAASGVIHSEMPKQKDGVMHGFQLWINLPAANKMDKPAYQEYTAEAFPIVETETATVKVVIGDFNGVASPIQDEITNVSYLDVQLKSNQKFQHELPETNNSFLYVFGGEVLVNGQVISVDELLTLPGAVDITAGEEGVRFLLVSGKPIHETIVQGGPFVMNTREEIELAIRAYQENTLVQDRALMN
jgi:redox-sensitive bicupin YhaK (pirin superfamily)